MKSNPKIHVEMNSPNPSLREKNGVLVHVYRGGGGGGAHSYSTLSLSLFLSLSFSRFLSLSVSLASSLSPPLSLSLSQAIALPIFDETQWNHVQVLFPLFLSLFFLYFSFPVLFLPPFFGRKRHAACGMRHAAGDMRHGAGYQSIALSMAFWKHTITCPLLLSLFCSIQTPSE